ncbi:uncharacterized protein LY79DRAFT_679386 [Colletotrichum navitas]|uniref:Uncharacterized protein n=1 Tax=Colletotrichum navitas TaxID=681940 RepID=A0AAD8PM75_9PEZI|nr:uncharacterized protein LY79DRAFT_679386 [Colletotrichum navitas]KAK1569817.1 hypothetical protein LY79DRAFT_679386 [Colletotrichum navitas]
MPRPVSSHQRCLADSELPGTKKHPIPSLPSWPRSAGCHRPLDRHLPTVPAPPAEKTMFSPYRSVFLDRLHARRTNQHARGAETLVELGRLQSRSVLALPDGQSTTIHDILFQPTILGASPPLRPRSWHDELDLPDMQQLLQDTQRPPTPPAFRYHDDASSGDSSIYASEPHPSYTQLLNLEDRGSAEANAPTGGNPWLSWPPPLFPKVKT